MSIGPIGIVILILIFVVVLAVAWVMSGMMRISFELLLIFVLAEVVTIVMGSFLDLTDIYQIIVISGIPILFIGYFTLRYNQLIKDPYRSLLKNLDSQKNRNFNIIGNHEDERFGGELDNLHKLFNENTRQINLLLNLTHTNEQMVKDMSHEIYTIVGKVKTDVHENIDEIDEIIQSVLLLDESLQKILEEIKDINTELELKYNEIKISLDNADQISDQTNLIAVNAAIEAAHSGKLGENFNIVAESISQLSSKSRASTNKLIQEVNSFQSITESRLTAVENQTQNIDDLLVQIAELSNDASVFVHSQKSLTEKLEELSTTILHKSKETYEELSKYSI